MVLAGLTPPEWEISIVDENLGAPDYPALLRPDLVGITAFTSQANRAYEVATRFRRMGVPVVMGGIHATMCLEEVMGNFSYRSNMRLNRKAYTDFKSYVKAGV
jgi:radical SAM superfamily enzyme YgiQ (UPF0313 family)